MFIICFATGKEKNTYTTMHWTLLSYEKKKNSIVISLFAFNMQPSDRQNRWCQSHLEDWKKLWGPEKAVWNNASLFLIWTLLTLSHSKNLHTQQGQMHHFALLSSVGFNLLPTRKTGAESDGKQDVALIELCLKQSIVLKQITCFALALKGFHSADN